MPLAVRLGPRTSWLIGTCLLGGALSLALVGKAGSRSWFLPGPTTHGHHQIELSCQSCHSSAFADGAAIQAACEGCHSDELAQARDSHPKSKFLDPRNAERLAELDARQCVTCHAEHRPEVTLAMGVTLPEDYCYRCHQDIEEERPSHRGMAFDSCDDAGCHNFHDNRALYEDFLAEHLNEPDVLPLPKPAARSSEEAVERPLGVSEFDAPPSALALLADAAALEGTIHTRSGVNCSGCHTSWSQAPTDEGCARCHEAELQGFRRGRHGMRTGLGLGPMTVGDAVVPMRPDAHGRSLGCTSCHGAHDFDLRKAASAACQGCHADQHTLAYETSPHADLLRKEARGELTEGSGVSCATCHLPRLEHDGVAFVEHNQNANLRPSEKMVRDVCQRCHGLGFSLDSLADRALVENNFTGRPRARVQSLALVARRLGHPEPTTGSPAR